MDRVVKKTIFLESIDPRAIFGINDQNLRMIEESFPAKIVARDSQIVLQGAEEVVEQISLVFSDLIACARADLLPQSEEVSMAINRAKTNQEGLKSKEEFSYINVSNKKEKVRPKTSGQREYVRAIAGNDVVFSIGPAGTGKTYLAVAMAVDALRQKKVDRIILVRPAVEAGESLGFLPGDLREKIDPYLKPLYDALYDMMPASRTRKFLETGIIEIAPLAYMRGRTLNNSFIILDEAQNSTASQMKMFLTRLGVNSKAVITGDITQVDLSDKKASGLIQVQSVIGHVDGIKFIYLTKRDVVRHKLVQEIIKAYENYEKKE